MVLRTAAGIPSREPLAQDTGMNSVRHSVKRGAAVAVVSTILTVVAASHFEAATATRVTTAAKFVTNNQGNDTRNAS